MESLKVAIVAENASERFGGEAILPLHYFNYLQKRNINAWLIINERCKSELMEKFGNRKNIIYVQDTRFQRTLWKLNSHIPQRIFEFTLGFLMRIDSQIQQRKVLKNLIINEKIDIVHQPTPVSPKEPSFFYNFSIPVIIGPMNGGIDYPPAFKKKENLMTRAVIKTGRTASSLLNHIIPGKKRADLLLVANDRTKKSLPKNICKNIKLLAENGIEPNKWKSKDYNKSNNKGNAIIFVGRLVDWKGVDLLIEAFEMALQKVPNLRLTIIGNGTDKEKLTRLAESKNLIANGYGQDGKIYFSDWLTQDKVSEILPLHDIFVLPSLMECGGAVVLEAMASGLPVISINWGGPADYIDSNHGVLVCPESKETIINDISNSLVELSNNYPLRKRYGELGLEKVINSYSWDSKIDTVIGIYHEVINYTK